MEKYDVDMSINSGRVPFYIGLSCIATSAGLLAEDKQTSETLMVIAITLGAGLTLLLIAGWIRLFQEKKPVDPRNEPESYSDSM